MLLRALTCSAIAIAAFMAIQVSAFAQFSDVPMGHWAYDAVDYLESEGLVTGYPDGTFHGNSNLNRYEFAVVISRMYDQFLDMIEDADGPEPEIDVEAILNMLMQEFEPELDDLRALILDNISRIEAIEGAVDGLDDRFEEINGRIDDMNDRFSPYGDIRLRFEGKYPETGLQAQRPRFRLRWGFKSNITDELQFVTRFGSGAEGEITSTNRTIGDYFALDDCTIDRAYMRWRPATWPGLTFYGGKFAPPWVTTALVRDSDTNVEGVAQHYAYENFNFYLGELVPNDEGFYLVAQAGADDLFIEGFDFYVTYHYINEDCWQWMMEDMMNGDLKSRWDFDRLDSPDDYRAIEAYGKFAFDLDGIPLAVEGNYLRNLEDAAEGYESAWNQAAWARLSVMDSPSNPGDWRLRVEWGKAQANSVLSWLTDSDRGSGDHEWLGASWTYRLLRNTDLGITYLNTDRLSRTGGQQDLVQVDIATKF